MSEDEQYEILKNMTDSRLNEQAIESHKDAQMTGPGEVVIIRSDMYGKGHRVIERNSLQYNGVDYNLNHWITLANYAAKHRIKTTSVVTNWIKRGRIPQDCVVTIPELNDLTLIKDSEYPPIKKGITKFADIKIT